MSTLAALLSTLGDFFKIAPGLILLPFSVYFFWKKISHKAAVSFSLSFNRVSAPQLSNIVISNLKDKPLVIWAIHATINKEHWITIQKFKTPIILKGLEITSIEPPPVSEYSIKTDSISNPFGTGKNVSIYITTTDKTFKCSQMYYPEYQAKKKFSELTYVTSIINKFKGTTYNSNAKFAVIYEFNGSETIALLEHDGIMTHGWPFSPNRLHEHQIEDAETVKKTLEGTDIAKIIKIISVQDLKTDASSANFF
ncbi:hypothetical protein A7J50_4373 [Pseudomonas antarctica]|uniref:Uncharacterized protein n=1 Tax=Pseudomonas antarctica TaxID=219572 RepID=A0A172Z5Z3_9PSED|nr:hypothetical protein [Pseudomonas antarctica]ANF87728.1 hypothetical protein A7J50_4373 [Pseudomonas antarctica]